MRMQIIQCSGYDYTPTSAKTKLAEIGVTYDGWGGSNFTDTITFEKCENVPDRLPEGMTTHWIEFNAP